MRSDVPRSHVREQLSRDIVGESRRRHLPAESPGATHGRARRRGARRARVIATYARRRSSSSSLVPEGCAGAEGAVLHAGNEHDRKFEAHGGMHVHEVSLPAAPSAGHLVRKSATRRRSEVREVPPGTSTRRHPRPSAVPPSFRRARRPADRRGAPRRWPVRSRTSSDVGLKHRQRAASRWSQAAATSAARAI